MAPYYTLARSTKADRHKASQASIIRLVYLDLNAPFAMALNRLEDELGLLASVLSEFPGKFAGVVVLPDRAREGSVRGLQDEISQFEKVCDNLGLYCDQQFIVVLDVVNLLSGARSSLRRWSQGRIVVHKTAKDNHEFLANSMLATIGWPEEMHVLPKITEVQLLESVDKDDDMRTGNRFASARQLLELKGPGFAEIVLSTALRGLGHTCDTNVVIVDPVGYAGETARAVLRLDLAKTYGRMHYIGFWTEPRDQNIKFARTVASTDIVDAFLGGSLVIPGFSAERAPPALTDADLSTIPFADVARGDLSKLRLAPLVLAEGVLDISREERAYWESANEAYRKAFSELSVRVGSYKDALAFLHDKGCVPKRRDDEEGAEPVHTGTGTEWKSKEELVSKVDMQITEGAVEVEGVKLYVSKTGERYLLSEGKDRIIPARTHLGAFGAGKYEDFVTVPVGPDVPGVRFALPQGDRTIVEFESQAASGEGGQATFTVEPLYVLLRRMESQGIVQHKMAFTRIERKVVDHRDSYTVEVTSEKLFKFVPDARVKGEQLKSSKYVFSVKAGTLPSSALGVAFRFRLDTAKNLKVLKPYVVTTRAIKLPKDVPIQAPTQSVLV